MITQFKIFEKYNLLDIENIELIKNKKFLDILEFYVCSDPKNKLTLNIPVDFYFTSNYPNSNFSENKPNNNVNIEFRHYYMIESMWMSLKTQHFKEFKEKPYFIINALTKDSKKQQKIGEFEDRFIIRESDTIIINYMHKYVMDHQEVVSANKYNL